MQNAGPSEILLVLGMHRSGTSALTRCMNLLGYAAPKTLIKSNKRNLSGHWESEPVARLNDELMGLGDLTWDDWRKGSLDRLRARDQRDFAEDLVSVLASEFPGGQACVLKGPRICRLMPYYRAALEGKNVPLRVIIPVRNPLEVMRSLNERNNMNAVDAGLLWLRYVTDAVSGSFGLKRAFVAYDQFLDDPIGRLSALEDKLDTKFPIGLETVSNQISTFLEPGLKHHAFSTIDVAHDPLTEGWVSQAYAALLVLCEDPESAVALETLNRIREAFDQSSDVLSAVSLRYRQTESELRALHEGVAAELSAATEAATSAKEETAKLAARHANEYEALDARFKTVQQALTDTEAELEMNRISAEQLTASDQELAAAHAEAVALTERLAAAQEQIKAAEAELSEKRAELENLRAREVEQGHVLQAELEAVRVEHNRDKRLLDDARARADRSEANRRKLFERGNKQLDQSDRLRKKAELEAGDLLSRLKMREKELRQLNRQFWRLKDELKWSKEIVRAYEGSTSWKITSPLRKAVRIMRGSQAAPVAPVASPVPPLEMAEAPKPVTNARASEKPAPASKPQPSKAGEVGLLESSAEFDKAYYLANYPDAQVHPEGAEAHFLEIGWKKGYKPSATFETKAYLASHPELVEKGICPLIHFIETQAGKPAAAARHLNGAAPEAPVKGARIAVFTAISKGYDDLKEPEVISEHADYFVFTDGVIPEGSVWKALPFEFVSHDPTRTARFVKTHPHLYFKDYDWAIWVDANLMLTCAAEELLPAKNSPDKILTWSHPLRECVFDEGAECIKRSKDSEGIIDAQMASLKQRDFPRKAGLYETSVMVTKMGDAQIEEMFNVWWSEISRWSRRDQLSLPVAVLESDVQIGLLARERICMRTDPRFVYFGHAGR